jgi:cell division protein FtsW
MITNWLRTNLKGDRAIWIVVVFLTMFSIAGVYSSIGTLAYRKQAGNTEYYLLKHSLLMLVGLSCLYFAHKANYRHFAKWSKIGLVISLPLLLFAVFKGTEINSASRWFTIPIIGQTVQPSDLAKLSLITYVAAFLSKYQNTLELLRKQIFWLLAWIVVICGMIMYSNFSTGIMLLGTCGLLMLVGRVPMKLIGSLALLGILAGGVMYVWGERGKTLVSRIEVYMSADDVPFQAEQGFIAIASGGWIGRGPGNSQQKDFLPHPYSDFIYAILVEEYGFFIGGILPLALYLTLLWRGTIAVRNSSNAFAGLLSAGLTISLVLQALLNMCVAVGLFPVTGQPLPLVSMGGNSLIATGLSIGIILAVSRADKPDQEPDGTQRRVAFSNQDADDDDLDQD